MKQSVDVEAEPDDAQACSENAMPSRQGNRTEEVKEADAYLAWAHHASASNGFGDASVNPIVLLQPCERSTFVKISRA